MPRLIFKCRYLPPGKKSRAAAYLRYIATREGVQKNDETWKRMPVTDSQQRLITRILEDFPDAKESFAYADYLAAPTRAAATEFLNEAIEAHADREGYVRYIANRPRVERLGTHGLFSDTDEPIALEQFVREMAAHEGNVWTPIISLRREDAARLGYDRAEQWRNLLRAHAVTFAEQMKIPLEDLRWAAAFHDESFHPHCHMVVYSAGRQPYLSRAGIDNLRSALARDIFKQDLVQVYEQQTQLRNQLTAESREEMVEIVRSVSAGEYDNPVVEDLLRQLADHLSRHKGKPQYGYLSQTGRNLVRTVVDELAKDERIARLYALWYEQREQVISTYRDGMPERVPLSENKDFQAIRNAVVKEALMLSQHSPLPTQEVLTAEPNHITSVEAAEQKLPPPVLQQTAAVPTRSPVTHAAAVFPSPQTAMGALRLFGVLARMLESRIREAEPEEVMALVDSKQQQEILEKQQLHGMRME